MTSKKTYLSYYLQVQYYLQSQRNKSIHAFTMKTSDAVHRILRCLKSEPGKWLLYTKNNSMDVRYCTLVGGSHFTWKSKKQHMVARSGTEAEIELWPMEHVKFDGQEVGSLLQDPGVKVKTPMRLYSDNQAALYISENPVFPEKEANTLKQTDIAYEKNSLECHQR